MKNNIILVVILLLLSTNSNAQLRTGIYTNLLNPFAYNPALAGSHESIQAIFNTRGIAGGVDGGARTYNFGIHAPLSNNTMGIGAKFLSSSVGAFQTINAEAAYCKFVRIGYKANLRLGLSLGITQTNLKADLLNAQVDKSDPALNAKDLNKILFSSGIGMYYTFDKKAEIGLSFPALMTGDKPLNNMMIINAAWAFYLGAENSWKIKPILNLYKLNISPNMADALLQISVKDVYSLTGGARSNGSVIAGLGLNLKSFAINYAYYYQIAGMTALAPVQNEIAIAFSFGEAAKR